MSASSHNVAAGTDKTIHLCSKVSNKFYYDRVFWNFYGRCWLDVGEKYFIADEAGKCFTKAIEISKGKYADDWYGLGMVLQFQGKYDEAVNYYLKSIKFDPTYMESKFRIWSLYQDGFIADNFGINILAGPGDYLMDFDFNQINNISPKNIIKMRKVKQFGSVIFRNVLKQDKFLSCLKDEIMSFTTKYNYKNSFIAAYDDADGKLKHKIQKIVNEKNIEKNNAFHL